MSGARENMATKLGDIIPCDILAGDVVGGEAAGLVSGYRLLGVGQVRMRDVYPSAELTDACQDGDTCWAARVVAVPES